MSAKVTQKVCLLGDGGVGKTSLIRRFVQDEFSDAYLVTFGTKVSKKTMDRPDTYLTLLIWDILGQKRHSRLHASYYKGAAGALVVCDITRRETLTAMVDWVTGFREVAGSVPVVLLANKADLLEEDGAFGMEDLAKIAKEHDASHLPTSAKTGHNVEAAFSLLSDALLARLAASSSSTGNSSTSPRSSDPPEIPD